MKTKSPLWLTKKLKKNKLNKRFLINQIIIQEFQKKINSKKRKTKIIIIIKKNRKSQNNLNKIII